MSHKKVARLNKEWPILQFSPGLYNKYGNSPFKKVLPGYEHEEGVVPEAALSVDPGQQGGGQRGGLAPATCQLDVK